MIADRFPQESSQFSFFNPKSRATDGRRSLDSADYAAWAVRMKGAWSRRASFGGRRRGWKHLGEEGIERLPGEEEEEEEDESGTPSPPLWKGGSPMRFPASQPHIDEQAAGATQPVQEIALRRQELLERLRGVAEPDYELSLTDMVNPPPAPSPEKRERKIAGRQAVGKKSGQGRRGIARSETGGFLLKMLSFPISVGEGNGREGGQAPEPPRSKVSEAKKGALGEDRRGGGLRRVSELGGIGSSSSSSGSSSGSRSSGRSSGRIKRMSSCYSFLLGKNTAIMDDI